MKNDEIIRSIKMLMIETGYDEFGGRTKISKALGIHIAHVSAALTGYNSAPRSLEILKEIKAFLRKQL